jgi:hypothetical protein
MRRTVWWPLNAHENGHTPVRQLFIHQEKTYTIHQVGSCKQWLSPFQLTSAYNHVPLRSRCLRPTFLAIAASPWRRPCAVAPHNLRALRCVRDVLASSARPKQRIPASSRKLPLKLSDVSEVLVAKASPRGSAPSCRKLSRKSRSLHNTARQTVRLANAPERPQFPSLRRHPL